MRDLSWVPYAYTYCVRVTRTHHENEGKKEANSQRTYSVLQCENMKLQRTCSDLQRNCSEFAAKLQRTAANLQRICSELQRNYSELHGICNEITTISTKITQNYN